MPEKEEYLKKSTKKYQLYFYRDPDKKIDQRSSEIRLDEDKLIFYPFGYNGGPKYQNIERIEILGFRGRIPVGLIKSFYYGWGFTKVLNPLAYFIDETFNINCIIVEKNGKVEYDPEESVLYINEVFLSDFHRSLTLIFKKNKHEVENGLRNELNKYFPKYVEKPQEIYHQNDLARIIHKWGNDINEFSEEDKKEIAELFRKLSLSTSFISESLLNDTKRIIDKKYILETIKKFEECMQLTSDTKTLEKKWQEFLKEYSWMFSSLFAQPIILFQREAYVGGKTIDNSDGKFTDFLLINKLSENVVFFEIKTHLTKLVENTPYRGDNIYSVSKELSGCIVQILNQRDNFQKEYYSLKAKNKIKDDFTTLSSQCIVLAGSFNSMNDNQKHSYELFRRNCSEVDILTFDEMLLKIEMFSDLIG